MMPENDSSPLLEFLSRVALICIVGIILGLLLGLPVAAVTRGCTVYPRECQFRWDCEKDEYCLPASSCTEPGRCVKVGSERDYEAAE